MAKKKVATKQVKPKARRAKTVPNTASVADYLDRIADESRRKDCRGLALGTRATQGERVVPLRQAAVRHTGACSRAFGRAISRRDPAQVFLSVYKRYVTFVRASRPSTVVHSRTTQLSTMPAVT